MNVVTGTYQAKETRVHHFSDTALKTAARFWFIVAAIGHWIFLYYIISFYGSTGVEGDFSAWNKVLPHGYVPGESIGNLAVILHILFSVVIIGGGPLQLIPQIRTHALPFHRWNGRLYVVAVCATSIVGLYMVWTRGVLGGMVAHIAISLDAILILFFSIVMLKYVHTGKINQHRRWALRLFMVSSAVWFFRVGMMFWLTVNQGPVGFNPDTFQGPFLTFWFFAQYLLPLAVLEIYLRVQNKPGAIGKFATALCIGAITIAMGIGIFAATFGMWLPRL